MSDNNRSKPLVLVVDDEEHITELLAMGLGFNGFEVERAANGRAALAAIDARRPDLAILDVMMPDLGGFDVAKRIRQTERAGSRMPIIFLTAKDATADKVEGLRLGADDYVTKPFSLVELLARVKARLRRRAGAEPDVPSELEIGPAKVDLRAMKVTLDGRAEELSLREVDMLKLLWRERGRPVSRERFLEEVWGHERFPTTRTVDQHMLKLRQKLERDPAEPKHLLTAFGVGYRLEC